jgi:hypothetical protein
MKVLGEGLLRESSEEAIGYVKGLPFVDAFIIGMLTKEEIGRSCALAGG